MIDKPELLTAENAKNLNAGETAKLFARHMNPGQLHFLKLLGFDKVIVDRAEGMYYEEKGVARSRLFRWLWLPGIRSQSSADPFGETGVPG